MRSSTKISFVVIAVAATFIFIYLGSYRTKVAPPTSLASHEEVDLVEMDGSWHRDIEFTHRADQYDCLEAAIKQLSVQLVDFIEQQQETISETVAIALTLEGDRTFDIKAEIEAWLERSLRFAVAEKLPNTRIRLERSLNSTEDLVDQYSTEPSEIELMIATLDVSVAEVRGAQSFVIAPSVYFRGKVTGLPPLQIAQKRWIRQMHAYRNNSGAQNLRQYRAETMEQVSFLMARDFAKQWRDSASRESIVPTLSESQATKLISQESARLGLCVDQFEQTFQLSLLDGTEVPAMKRAALLVDCSPQKIDAAFQLLNSYSKHQRERFFSRLKILVPTAVVLLVAAFALDRVTLGYYTWRIRGAAAIVASTIFLLVA